MFAVSDKSNILLIALTSLALTSKPLQQRFFFFFPRNSESFTQDLRTAFQKKENSSNFDFFLVTFFSPDMCLKILVPSLVSVNLGRWVEWMGCSSMETYTLPYVKQIASENLLYDSGNSNCGSVITQRGWMEWEVGGKFKREGTYVYLWLIHVDVWQKPIQYCKAVVL